MAKQSPRSASGVSGVDVIQSPDTLPLKPVYVVYGEEDFLRSRVIAAVRAAVLGKDADEIAVTRFEGDAAALADVLDELALLPFFGARRLVIVSDADRFVSAHRDALERYVQSSHRGGVLLLAVQAWPSNTRLARMVSERGLAVECRLPDARQLAPWCRRWAQDQYGKRLSVDASELLVELVSGGLGQLDRELEKLTSYVGTRADIAAADVDRLVAAGRVEVVWKIIDRAADGDAASALAALDALVVAGEAPVFLLAAFATQLRRLARAYALVRGGEPVRSALTRAGIKPYFVDQAQAQLRHLGRDRLARLNRWLLETDLGMKGDSALSPQHLLERLMVRIAARQDGALVSRH
jgi:DNA polymerase-3 subunit delta